MREHLQVRRTSWGAPEADSKRGTVPADKPGQPPHPARSLVLGPDAPPRGAQESGKQGITLLLVAFVNVIDRASHECGGGCPVKGPAIGFHCVCVRLSTSEGSWRDRDWSWGV